MNPMKRIAFASCLLCFIAAVGCGGPSPSPVHGTVVYNGAPVPDVNVVFVGKDEHRANGVTDSSGNFSKLTTLKDGDGAVPGEYTVIITPRTTVSENPEKAEDYAVPEEKPPAFPPKYSDISSSGLKVTVKSGDNDIKLELKD